MGGRKKWKYDGGLGGEKLTEKWRKVESGDQIKTEEKQQPP